jgi:hypothetical protein
MPSPLRLRFAPLGVGLGHGQSLGDDDMIVARPRPARLSRYNCHFTLILL